MAEADEFQSLRDRVAELEAKLAAADRRHAPPLWQDIGRQPLPPLPPVMHHVRAAAGDDAQAQGEFLAGLVERIGKPAAADVMASMTPERLLELAAGDSSPLPTTEDRVRYHGDNHPAFWLSGLADAVYIDRLAERHGRPLTAGRAFLDFGCASGRVLRHVERLHLDAEVYGADLSVASLTWIREHLPDRIRLIQATMIPSLPLPDASVDIVFAGSVFTHVAEFEESLLHELRRITRPGGLLLLSVQPERGWDNIGQGREPGLLHEFTRVPHRAEPGGVEPVTAELFQRPMPADRVVVTNTRYPINNHYTFHSRRWIERHWTAGLDLVEIIEQGHGVRQDLVVLRRR